MNLHATRTVHTHNCLLMCPLIQMWYTFLDDKFTFKAAVSICTFKEISSVDFDKFIYIVNIGMYLSLWQQCKHKCPYTIVNVTMYGSINEGL